MWHPKDDGITHINIYSKGATALGRKLTNFAKSPFIHPEFGEFESVEGFWYWRKALNYGFSSEVLESIVKLRSVSGIKAKTLGKHICDFAYGCPVDNQELFREDILEAIRCKLRQNRDILNLLTESELPLAHYYYWGEVDNPKVKELPEFDWITNEFERIRKVMKEHVKKTSGD